MDLQLAELQIRSTHKLKSETPYGTLPPRLSSTPEVRNLLLLTKQGARSAPEGVEYVTQMNLHNLIFQMVELLHTLYHTNS